MPPPLPPGDLRLVDPRIWRACAGASVQIPLLRSRVYYFPQGHLEQSCSSPASILSPLALSKPLIPCIIAAVHFFADPVTDEVFTRLLLHPVSPSQLSAHDSSANQQQQLGGRYDDEDDKIVAFAKILTPSDANNGGGFSVPRFCADSIFPVLNYQAEPPVQTLSVTDVHGAVWEFRHIYRGTPRRHLLTTGWSKFVNHKKLIAGDSVVFMKSSTGKMFIGVRRAVRFGNGSCDYARWRNQIGGGVDRVTGEETEGEGIGREGFARSGRGRLTPEAVAEAAERAALGRPFEVVYYPRAGWSDFIVKAEVVEAALSVFWVPGMRVKMAMETEDSSRLTWFQGTVSSSQVRERGPWSGSPWRMLQITWDEPEILQSAKRVSPWQVEFLAPTPPLQTTFPPAKKLKFSQNSGFVSEGDSETFFPTAGLNNSTMGQLKPSLLSYKTFPAGMQGARQNNFGFFSLNNFMNENSSQTCTDNFFSNNMVAKLKRVSTELNIGSPQSDNLSPDSQSSFHSFVIDSVGNRGCNSTKVGISSFQLFGKVIHMEEPIESGFDGVGCIEDDNTRGCSETGGVSNLVDLSLTYPYMELLDRLDAQCQRASAVEACSL